MERIGDALGVVTARVTRDLERGTEFLERRGRETGGGRGEVRPRKTA